MPTPKIALAGALLAMVAVLTGCGPKVVDHTKTEIAVRYDVEEATGVEVASVDCPESVEVRAGNRFSCRVQTDDGASARAELMVLNDLADLRLIRLRKP